jgi:predicted Zn-ribbon and HTH transcriptional regulator
LKEKEKKVMAKRSYNIHTRRGPATRPMLPPKCAACGKPSDYLGAASGTCPSCQNKSVAELEASLGMKPGELGRVDAKGNSND